MRREKIRMDRPGMTGITAAVKEETAASGIVQGVCVITVLSAGAAVLVTSEVKREVRLDIMEELDRMIPPRLCGWAAMREAAAGEAAASEVAITEAAAAKEAAANAAITKASIIGGSLDIIISHRKPVLAAGQGIFLADYIGARELEFLITCC